MSDAFLCLPDDSLTAAVKGLHASVRRPLQLTALRIVHEKEAVRRMVRAANDAVGDDPFVLVYHAKSKTKTCYLARIDDVLNGHHQVHEALRWGFSKRQRAWKYWRCLKYVSSEFRLSRVIRDMTPMRKTEMTVVVRAASGRVTHWRGVYSDALYVREERNVRTLQRQVEAALDA